MEVRLAGPYLHGLFTIHVTFDDIRDCDGEEVIIHPRPRIIYIRVGRSEVTRVGLKFFLLLEPEAQITKNHFPSYGIFRVPHLTGAAN